MSSLLYAESGDTRDERSRYYPIHTDVTYRLLDGERAVGSVTGRTKAMSARRLVLESDTRLEPGTVVEVSLAWPLLLEDRIPLKLVIRGRVVQSPGSTAI